MSLREQDELEREQRSHMGGRGVYAGPRGTRRVNEEAELRTTQRHDPSAPSSHLRDDAKEPISSRFANYTPGEFAVNHLLQLANLLRVEFDNSQTSAL